MPILPVQPRSGAPHRTSRTGAVCWLVIAWVLLAAAPTGFGEQPWQAPPESGQTETDDLFPTSEQAASSADGDSTTLQERIRVPSFKDVTPGATSLADAKRLLGTPFSESTKDGQTTLAFQMEPFQKIVVQGAEQVVRSIVIYLREPSDAAQLAREVGVDQLKPAPIADEQGQVLGQAYPERGILFGFAPGAQPPQIAQVILEPISAEPFVLRARYDHDHQYESDLADLNYACALDPENASIHELLAKIHAAAGHYSAALQSAEEAIRLDPAPAAYRLTRARLLAEVGEHDQALQLTRALIARQDAPPEIQARAACQLGDLLASGARPDYKQAIQQHLAAIKLAVPLAGDSRRAVRLSAKRTLVDAHLAVAADVALGRWRRKAEVVPKWLGHAQAIADDLVKREQGDPGLTLLVHCKALEVFAGMGSPRDPAAIAESIAREAERLLQASQDRLYRGQLQRQMGQALLHAATIQRRRQRFSSALEYADQAIRYLEQGQAVAAESTPQQDFQLGRLYYLVGSIHAAKNDDHEKAVICYEKARPLLDRATIPFRKKAAHGQRLVTMGVSYWHTGARDEALELTEQGTSLIRQAVQDQTVSETALVIPYGNLAGMYRQLGHEQQARQFAETAAKLRAAGQAKRR